MTPKQLRTLVALAGIALMACLISLFEPDSADTAHDQQHVFPGVEKTDIVEIILQTQGTNERLTLNDGQWTINQLPGDSRRIEQLLEDLLTLKMKGPIKPAGVGFSGLVTLGTHQGEQVSVGVGRPAPGTAGVYLEAEGGVYISDKPVLPAAPQDIMNLRSRRVLHCSRSAVGRIDIIGTTQASLTRGALGWEYMDGNTGHPAQGKVVEALLDTLFDTRIESFQAKPPPPKSATVEVRLASSDKHLLCDLQVASNPAWLARRGGDAWVEITPGLASWLPLASNKFARQSVLWFDPELVDEFSFQLYGTAWSDTREDAWTVTQTHRLLSLLSKPTAELVRRPLSEPVGQLEVTLAGQQDAFKIDILSTTTSGLAWSPAGANFAHHLDTEGTARLNKLLQESSLKR